MARLCLVRHPQRALRVWRLPAVLAGGQAGLGPSVQARSFYPGSPATFAVNRLGRESRGGQEAIGGQSEYSDPGHVAFDQAASAWIKPGYFAERLLGLSMVPMHLGEPQ